MSAFCIGLLHQSLCSFNPSLRLTHAVVLDHNKMLSVPPPALNNVMREAADALMFYHQA